MDRMVACRSRRCVRYRILCRGLKEEPPHISETCQTCKRCWYDKFELDTNSINADKYRGINGQCRKCVYMKLATGRKSFCTCRKGYLQNLNRNDCRYFKESE